MASLKSCKWAVGEPHQSPRQMRSLIIIYGRNCPRFLGLQRRAGGSEAPKSEEVCEGLHVWWSCRKDLVWVQIPDPVWRIGAPLVCCLYFSTLASLHFDHSYSFTWVPGLPPPSGFKPPRSSFFPSLGSESTFMLAQIIVSTSSRAPRGSHFTLSWVRRLFYSFLYRAEPIQATFIAANRQLTIVAATA